MSLMVPVPAQGPKLPTTSSTDASDRTAPATTPDGLPFKQELKRALGQPVVPLGSLLPVSASTDETATVSDRLDPLGAALRALLGTEVDATATAQQPASADPVAATSAPKPKTDPVTPEAVLAAAASGAVKVPVSADLVVVTVDQSTESSTGPTSVSPQASHDPAPLIALLQTVSADATTQVPETAVAALAEAITAETPPQTKEAKTQADAEAKADQGAASPTSRSATTQRPTFADLVTLVTTAQAQDGARSAKPVLAAQQTTAVADSLQGQAPAVTKQLVAPETTEHSDPVVNRLDLPVGHAPATPVPAELEVAPAPAAPLPAPAILNQVARSIRVLAEGARSELQVKLHPAELGEVLVRLTIQDGVVQAQLHTTDAAVKATLDANLDALKARFEQHGMQVSSLAVSTGAGQLTDNGQAKSGWEQQLAAQQNRRPRLESEGDEPEAQQAPTPAPRILGRRPMGRLDHLA